MPKTPRPTTGAWRPPEQVGIPLFVQANAVCSNHSSKSDSRTSGPLLYTSSLSVCMPSRSLPPSPSLIPALTLGCILSAGPFATGIYP